MKIRRRFVIHKIIITGTIIFVFFPSFALAGKTPLIAKWAMFGDKLVTHRDISFSSAVVKVCNLMGVSVPKSIIKAILKAAKIDDSSVEVGVLYNKKEKEVEILLSRKSIVKATRIVASGGFGISNKGSWFLDTGYKEYKGGR